MKGQILICLAAFILPAAGTTHSQIIINPKKVLERKAAERANRAIDKAADQALDSITGKKANPPAKKDDKVTATDKNKKTDEVKADAAAPPSLQTYSKYDFIPGEKIVFFDDFSQDAVGDFPALWNTNGSGEVVTTNLFPGRWLQFKPKSYTAIWTDKLLQFPDNYTIEFDIIPTKGDEGERMHGYTFRLIQSMNVNAWDGGAVPGKAGFGYTMEYYGTHHYRTYLQGHIYGEENESMGLSGSNEEEETKQQLHQKYHIAIWVQKSRLRLYQNESKIFDIPKAFPLPAIKMDRMRFESGAAMVSNIRIAVGAPDMRNKLLTEGKIVSYGIYFDVNKDVVKPESYGSLKQIAAILTENPDVKIQIVGHTDADGADAANLDLSKRRAAAVKAELAKTFGIEEFRMETDGKGEAQPVAANDNSANKALNRRVEFIKL